VLLVPLVTLVVMWVLATWVTVPPGLVLLDAQTSVEAVGRPVQAVITQLQAERKLAVAYLAGADESAWRDQAQVTDAAVADLRARADSGDTRAALTGTGSTRLSELLLHLDGLRALRSEVGGGDVDRATALRRYTQPIDAGLSLSRALIRTAGDDLLREAQALMALAEARELLAREDAVVTGALAAGTLTQTDLSQAVTYIGAQRHQFGLAQVDLHVTDRLAYEEIATSEAAGTLAALEERLITEGRVGEAPPVDERTWRGAHDTLTDDLRALELAAADRLIERSRPQAAFIFTRIAVTGLVGLIALVVTALGSVRVARSLLNRLAGLRQAARELAVDRLPRVVERLRTGERVDVGTEAPPMPYGSDEIGQVGHAFNALQRTAVEAAVAEAELRRGVNEVFLNIARRSQTLLHRQLSILDGMERQAEDPAQLEELFRLDHLATRMRRNAEYLVILAGAAPGRGWRQPVPLVDVLRGGVSEIEDYARVTVRPVPDVAVIGRAVGDIIHLLAELIENATAFSPPNAKVVVGAEPVTNGLAIEIEDRGIGILPPILAELNARLTDPPDFAKLAERSGRSGEPGAGAQLGLFVVARLADRHGIQVQLRRSAYGGTTAVVLLPEDLLTVVTDPAALPAGSTGDLVPLTSASPTAPRSTLDYTPVAGQGDPLPSRRGAAAAATPPADVAPAGFAPPAGEPGDAETAVIVATAGRPLDEPASRGPGRHARREVIEPDDDPDGLPRRVRQRRARRAEPAPDEAADASSGPGDETDSATPAGGARSPEQVRAMMSSFQAGTDRGRREAGADHADPGQAGDPEAGGVAGLAAGEQSGTGTTSAVDGQTGRQGGRTRRRGAGDGLDDLTVEAT
jgi:signal transduction histidine kinase